MLGVQAEFFLFCASDYIEDTFTELAKYFFFIFSALQRYLHGLGEFLLSKNHWLNMYIMQLATENCHQASVKIRFIKLEICYF